jgi:4'-phosphopantetheinyl transferase
MTAPNFKNTLSITPIHLANLLLADNCILLLDAKTLELSDFNLPDHLSPFELIVINRRKSPQAKQEYLATRLLLKLLAKHYLKTTLPDFTNTPPSAISSEFDEVSSKLQLHINNEIVINACISHSHGFVGVALNPSKSEFGFDIEKISLKRPFKKLAKHFYHQDEMTLITQPSEIKNQANIFFRIWTLKESLAKATSCPIAKLLSPNVFHALTSAELLASSNVINVGDGVNHETFDVSVVHKKSTNWRCFLLSDSV